MSHQLIGFFCRSVKRHRIVYFIICRVWNLLVGSIYRRRRSIHEVLDSIITVKKQQGSSWIFVKESIADKAVINSVFTEYRPDIVVKYASITLKANIWKKTPQLFLKCTPKVRQKTFGVHSL